VCNDANERALDIMGASGLEAITVAQDVRTGALVAFAASEPTKLDVTTFVLPLSVCKLLLASSWWDHRQEDYIFYRDFDRAEGSAQSPANRVRVSVHEMLVGGSDSAGMQLAAELRRSIGTAGVLRDFKRYGFGQRLGSPPDAAFWGELAPSWRRRLIPNAASVVLSEETTEKEWADTLSIGEANMKVTVLHISRFLQAVGNNGIMLSPVAREEQASPSSKELAVPRRLFKNPIRVMQKRTALRLQSAMRDCVQRGSAKSIATVLAGTAWQIGGKTGSGPWPAVGPQLDGWFAGLVFDPQGKARFTVATYVRHGGYGGGNAARISAELARYIINNSAMK
jgi:cell division protein FtsI/penicillin-binding protein 2